MQITSTNFDNLEPIPEKYAADNDNINPMLTFSELPNRTMSLALTVEDPDAVSGLFTHWVVYNISPGILQIMEGQLPISGVEGKNSLGKTGYFGPKPPAGTGVHRYFFKLFALDEVLKFPNAASVDHDTLYAQMDGHILEQAEIIGTYAAPELA